MLLWLLLLFVIPAEPPASLARFLGDYADGAARLILLERDGKLYAAQGSAVSGPLDPQTLSFSDRTLQWNGRRWQRAGYMDQPGFRIAPVRPLAELRKAAEAATPPREPGSFRAPDLVDLARLDATLRFDIRYATRDNFLGAPVYEEARALLQRPAAEALVRAHRSLEADGLGLLIHDGFRPWRITKLFWDATPAAYRNYVADPAKGSRHNRGCAVDLTLFERATGRAVTMPSGYDEMSPRAHPTYPGGTTRQRWLRDRLRRAMEAHGFRVNPYEWWHYDHRDWRHYSIGN